MPTPSHLVGDDPSGESWRTSAGWVKYVDLVAMEAGELTAEDVLRAEAERRQAPPPSPEEVIAFREAINAYIRNTAASLARALAPISNMWPTFSTRNLVASSAAFLQAQEAIRASLPSISTKDLFANSAAFLQIQEAIRATLPAGWKDAFSTVAAGISQLSTALVESAIPSIDSIDFRAMYSNLEGVIASLDWAELETEVVGRNADAEGEFRWDEPVIIYFLLPALAIAVAGRGYQDYLENPERWNEIMNACFFISFAIALWKFLASQTKGKGE